ncbi:MAG: DUF4760 domain-containing protein [Woeseiaceae bacterium]|nr:DUF4760 domain-containing protein [Woeseiaceae bacterium]
MNDLSHLADIAEIVGAAIVIGGVFFAVMQMRQIRQQRREMAAIELFRFFGSPQFAKAYHCVLNLPDDLTTAELRKHQPEAENCAMLISTTMENIGVMVFHRIVPSVVVKDLMGTSAVILWKKLNLWVQDMREELDNPSAFEWFEWLARVLEELSDKDCAPAYDKHRDWKPSRSTYEI